MVSFLDWLIYYRRGKIKVRIINLGDSYVATASNGRKTVVNCYGSTKEQAKKLALYRLSKI